MPNTDRKRKRLTLACMCFALFMVMLDSTVVNLALKTIQLRMHASYSEVQWIVDAFVLALASLLLTGGTLGDLFGRRRAFISGLALFTGGSVMCALAPSTSFLIGSRVVQGVGGALMLPSTLSIITNTFRDPRERARAIGLWAGISGLALAVGPLIGGTLVDRFDWQSIFWINVPIGVVALVMAALFVPESSDRAGRSLDLPGQVTAVIGLVALTYAFIEANTYGWTSPRIVTCFVVSAVALTLFLVIELRGRSPLLQLKFFRNGTFSGANLVGVIVSFAFFGVIFFLSLFMQEVQGYTPTQAGALQLPATLGIMVAAIVSGRIVGRIGARLPITIGLLMTGTALLCLTSVQQTTGYASFWYWLLLMGIGNGLIMSPMTTAIMGTVPAPRAGMASATSNTMRQVGSVFGIAVLGNLVTRPITDQTLAAVRVLHLPPALTGGIMTAVREGRDLASGKLPPGVDGAALQHVVKKRFRGGLHLGHARRPVGERHHAAGRRAHSPGHHSRHGSASCRRPRSRRPKEARRARGRRGVARDRRGRVVTPADARPGARRRRRLLGRARRLAHDAAAAAAPRPTAHPRGPRRARRHRRRPRLRAGILHPPDGRDGGARRPGRGGRPAGRDARQAAAACRARRPCRAHHGAPVHGRDHRRAAGGRRRPRLLHGPRGARRRSLPGRGERRAQAGRPLLARRATRPRVGVRLRGDGRDGDVGRPAAGGYASCAPEQSDAVQTRVGRFTGTTSLMSAPCPLVP